MCPYSIHCAKPCNNYEKGKDLINILARIANFTTNGTHGALMLFSDPKNMEIKNSILQLDSSRNLIEFSDLYDTKTYTKMVNKTIQGILDNKKACDIGSTKIIKALDDSLNKMFQNSKGMREYVEQVAVLITDGRDAGEDTNEVTEGHPEYLSYRQKYTEMAENFKQRKIKVVAIGVGEVNDEFLNILVQSPQYFIKADTFDILLNNLTDLIGDIICKGMLFLP